MDVKAGHGGGKPTTKVIETIADQYAFLVKALGLRVSGVRLDTGPPAR